MKLVVRQSSAGKEVNTEAEGTADLRRFITYSSELLIL
jgi:hypothetical protein